MNLDSVGSVSVAAALVGAESQREIKETRNEFKQQLAHGRVRCVIMSAICFTGYVLSFIFIAHRIYNWATANIPQWEKDIHQKFGEATLNRIRNMQNQFSGDRYRRILRRLSKVNGDELEVLRDIFQLPRNDDHLLQIFRGAHIRIEDSRDLYIKWSKLAKARKRRSSHYRHDKTQQYGIKGEFIRECLFGREAVQKKQIFWFQLESYPAGFGTYIRHFYAFLKYKISDFNQGPYGSSYHIDSRALDLDAKVKAT